MTHHIDISNVQSIEIEPVAPNPLSTLESTQHTRRIVVRTRRGVTTILLHAASASELEVSVDAAPG